MINRNKYKFNVFIIIFFSFFNSIGQSSSKKFTVVLDAGHGGKDPGNSYHGYVEKNIALKTTLKVGDYLQKYKDIEVVFTRQTDVFIELVNRPKIANKEKADLFISIHCNSVKNFEPYGTETYVMGLSRTNMNLEVSKNENSVIMLEDNYKKTYKGFDPNKPETLLGIKLVQEENLNSSINLATKIQGNFVGNLGRKSRGVKQEPLWVLDASVMPGVLIELGFLSNKEEGEFLNSDAGQEKMAEQIAEAIVSYKKDNFDANSSDESDEKPARKNNDLPIHHSVETVKKDTVVRKTEFKKEPVKSDSIPAKNLAFEEVVYKVQISASTKKLETVPSNFKGLRNISCIKDNTLFKYMFGETQDYEEAKKLTQTAKDKGFPTSFIVAFKAGKLINVKDVLK